MGSIERNATALASRQTNRPGSSPEMMRLKIVGIATSVVSLVRGYASAWFDEARAVDRPRRERGRAAGRGAVWRFDRRGDACQLAGGHERHDATAEAGAGQPRTEGAP